jgi:ribosome maturation factor RimP
MGVLEDIEGVVRPVVEGAGLELVDVQFRPEENGWVLRFFIDKNGGLVSRIARNGTIAWGR